jgi:hypothetical protein
VKIFCPSCGSAVEFRYDDSFVRVCGSCRSVIVRTDRGIDTFGQFADLIPSSSGLAVDDAGRWGGQPFVLAGRATYRHPAGGTWEEWFVKLADGRWAWLSQAQGDWVLTFRSETERRLPAFEQLAPGQQISLDEERGPAFTVGECNQAVLIGAEGEIPFQFVPGTESRFADLSDDGDRFATLDYGAREEQGEAGEGPTVYVGRRVRLAELGLAERELPGRAEPGDAGQRLGCPNCGGSIELYAPGSSEVVACPYCGSLLDCKGPLSILAHLEKNEARRPPIPLGATGTFGGVRYTVIGRLQRQATYTDAFLEWDEYLLYERAAGYRWLVCANGHYSFVTPLAPGAVKEASEEVAFYSGKRFALYDAAEPQVSGVWGEFYWRVSVGETVSARDYIAPPLMLSREASPSEVHWSLGLYQTHDDVRRAFQLAELEDERQGVAGHQPFKHRHWPRVAAALGAAFILCTIIVASLAEERALLSQQFQLGGTDEGTRLTVGGNTTLPSNGASYVFFSPPFELEERTNARVSLSMPLENSWAYVIVDLIHEASGELRTFEHELSYYRGVEAGESWSEGSPSVAHVLAGGQGGSHVLRLEVQTPAPSRLPLSVKVETDVFDSSHVLWVLLALGVPAALLALRQYSFERRRWSESDFAPSYYQSSSDE